jgi:hypothetical protein
MEIVEAAKSNTILTRYSERNYWEAEGEEMKERPTHCKNGKG